IIYGVGYCTNQVYPILCKGGLKEHIIAFAVSKLEQDEQFEKHAVMQIDKIECDKDATVVLVSAHGIWQKEMLHNAQELGYRHILLLTDYVKDPNNLLRLYGKLNYVEFRRKIECKHTFYTGEDKEAQIESKFYTEKHIVFISGCFKPRDAKIINALKRKGFEVTVILYGRDRWSELFAEEIVRNEINPIKCKDEEDMIYCMMQYRPMLYYFEPIWADCRWVSILLKHKSHFRPIVLALYDVINDGHAFHQSAFYRVWKALLESERYALENADGIVWRWYSKEYLEQRKGFAYKGKSIQFPDYCGNYIDETEQPEKEDSEILKLCSLRGSFTDFGEKDGVPDGYERVSTLEEILKLIGNRKDCILHMYMSRCDNPKDYEESLKLEEKYSNIKFFWSVDHMELIERLQEYDYGCRFYNEGEPVPMDQVVKYCGTFFFGSDNENAVTNALIDYVDAALPIIVKFPHKQVDFLEKYGVIVKMPTNEFDFDFLKEQKRKYKKNAWEARKLLAIDEHIQELIDFFEEVSRNALLCNI
ncbi:MAG: hypothetical protein K2G55_05850, partial [Lachnospiraceae bacterium]|nr:hypothetical protein [Lachnospiraceae bacterium]